MNIVEKVKLKFDIETNLEIPVHEFDLSNEKVIAIIGQSGTGKTTLLRQLFNYEKFEVNEGIVIELLNELCDDEDLIMKTLFDCGLQCVPIWLNDVSTLSNGEKMRFELAYKLLNDESTIIIDEFTSVLDRPIAENLCESLNKIISKYDKRIVVATVHDDILNWLNTDVVYDTNLKKQYATNQIIKDNRLDWKLKRYQEIGGNYLNDIII